MASIINSLSFKNFFNYYGDFEIKYDFEEGINIIVADNGAGKSKFFNAFLWLFYDQILDSDDLIKKSIKDAAYKIISDKAKSEISIGEKVETAICIEYSNGRNKFKITKSFTGIKLNDNITSPDCWQIIINDDLVDKTELVLHSYKPVYDADEKIKIIKQLISPNLRQYSFFQGEEVDSMIDFGKKSSIEDAVRTLTDISNYEDLVKLSKSLKDSAEKDLNKQTKSNSEHNERLQKAIDLKSKLEEEFDKDKIKLADFEALYDEAEKEKNDLEQNFGNAQKRNELDILLKEKSKKVKEVALDYNHHLDSINSRFFDGNFAWISLGFDDVVSKFQEKIQLYRENHFEKKAILNISNDPNKNFHFLPLNSPDAVSLKNMIDHEHCYVCNRPAKHGTEEYEYIVKLKNRPLEEKKETEYVKNNLNTFFSDIQINAQPFYNKISNILDSEIQTRDKESALNDRLTKLKKEEKTLRDQRNDIMIAGSSDEDASTIINRYKGAIRRLSDTGNQIERTKENISRTKKLITNTETEIQSLRPKNLPEGFVLNYDICNDLANAIENAKNRVFDNMVSLLEKHANNHFQNLIKYNDLAGGILKFDKTISGSINFDYVDTKDNIVHGASQGFQRMKKFSVVMAVISANTKRYNYPLLADAPLSAFGDGFTEGFFEAIGDVFPQSIVLVKDLYKQNDEVKLNELGKKLFKDPKVKTMYVNQVPENVEQVDLVTTKIKLK